MVSEIYRSTLEKLSMFDDLEPRLTAFKRFVDTRFASKRVVLSRDNGLEFEVTDGGGCCSGQRS